jgi:uncharacterized coiled-coil protein SlyX
LTKTIDDFIKIEPRPVTAGGDVPGVVLAMAMHPGAFGMEHGALAVKLFGPADIDALVLRLALARGEVWPDAPPLHAPTGPRDKASVGEHVRVCVELFDGVPMVRMDTGPADRSRITAMWMDVDEADAVIDQLVTARNAVLFTEPGAAVPGFSLDDTIPDPSIPPSPPRPAKRHWPHSERVAGALRDVVRPLDTDDDGLLQMMADLEERLLGHVGRIHRYLDTELVRVVNENAVEGEERLSRLEQRVADHGNSLSKLHNDVVTKRRERERLEKRLDALEAALMPPDVAELRETVKRLDANDRRAANVLNVLSREVSELRSRTEATRREYGERFATQGSENRANAQQHETMTAAVNALVDRVAALEEARDPLKQPAGDQKGYDYTQTRPATGCGVEARLNLMVDP